MMDTLSIVAFAAVAIVASVVAYWVMLPEKTGSSRGD